MSFTSISALILIALTLVGVAVKFMDEPMVNQ